MFARIAAASDGLLPGALITTSRMLVMSSKLLALVAVALVPLTITSSQIISDIQAMVGVEAVLALWDCEGCIIVVAKHEAQGPSLS